MWQLPKKEDLKALLDDFLVDVNKSDILKYLDSVSVSIPEEFDSSQGKGLAIRTRLSSSPKNFEQITQDDYFRLVLDRSKAFFSILNQVKYQDKIAVLDVRNDIFDFNVDTLVSYLKNNPLLARLGMCLFVGDLELSQKRIIINKPLSEESLNKIILSLKNNTHLEFLNFDGQNLSINNLNILLDTLKNDNFTLKVCIIDIPNIDNERIALSEKISAQLKINKKEGQSNVSNLRR